MMQHGGKARRGEVHTKSHAALVHPRFSAYAMMAGTSNKGCSACPVCGPNTHTWHSEHLSKVVYGGRHRRWLPREHPFCHDTNVFETEELEEEPCTMDAHKHIHWAYARAEYARFGGRLGANGDRCLPAE